MTHEQESSVFTRRRFLRGAAAVGALPGIAAVLAACGGEDAEEGSPCTAGYDRRRNNGGRAARRDRGRDDRPGPRDGRDPARHDGLGRARLRRTAVLRQPVRDLRRRHLQQARHDRSAERGHDPARPGHRGARAGERREDVHLHAPGRDIPRRLARDRGGREVLARAPHPSQHEERGRLLLHRAHRRHGGDRRG